MKIVKSNQTPSIRKVTVPKWKANLFISLFHADGGDGFTAKEIEDAELFIQKNGLLSLVDIAEFDEAGCYLGDEAICSFRVSSEMQGATG